MKERIMKYTVIAPHLDDGALSCGELIVKLIKEGHDVSVAVIFSGMPPADELSDAAKQYHSTCSLGDDAGYIRQKEEIDACSIMGCRSIHLGYLEALYRKDSSGRYIYPNHSDITRIAGSDNEIISELSRKLPVFLEDCDKIIVPLALGDHADHLVVRKVVTGIDSLKRRLLFYEDIPYIFFDNGNIPEDKIHGMKPILFDIDRRHLSKKLDALMCYRSQLHTMWKTEDEMRQQLEDHLRLEDGGLSLRLWSLQ